ncbi:MAG: tetratricopeptide repeat protein [Ardenticatenaceae bacterium]|nr:tetratricopeptide repeat protein [Anaerolineales bacterium]MCB8920352.1 tetratricopeptide repeat protein [Ardenticatenaceae bacterium]MCB8989307.1 tetratricopeptide repeat protein [Ardenticatenaceae bacterium]
MLNAVPDNQLTLPERARRLAAYIPVTLARQILDAGLPVPGTSRRLLAATLFSDMSGFTAMSEELASDGSRGAEEVNRVLRQTFTAMIDIIHAQGGAVSHFYGDAMSVYFPDSDGQAAVRALACARHMQDVMLTQFRQVITSRPPGKQPAFPLTMKIGVGYGRCQELIVGDPDANLEFALTGPAIDEAATAEKEAHAGEIVASRAVLAQVNLPAAQPFTLFTATLDTPSSSPLLDWAVYGEADLQRFVDLIPPFIPPALYQRLTTPGLEVLAEHRPVTSLFVQFDFAANEGEGMGQQHQDYYTWACQIVARFGHLNGRVNRVLTGDKGNQLHIMFGAPVAPDAPEQAIRCALALQHERPDFIAAQHIGLCTGKVFAGPVGAASRHEYTVVGDVVNLSARLAQACATGDVLTDAATAERVENVLEFETLPPQKMKGKQADVIPYRALSDRSAQVQLQAYFDIERPLIGRDAEMELLQVGLDAASKGFGGLAAVIGGAGVGKTRLLGEMVQRWQTAGGLPLMGVCHPHTADTPYGPWRDIWRALFGLSSAMEVQAQVTAVQQITQTLWPNVGDDVGLWAEVLGLPIPQTPILAELTAEARQARFFTLVERCFRAWANTQPLLFVLENIHWADQATLALIDYLTQTMEQSAIYIAFSFREGALDAPFATLESERCTPIMLADLSPRHARHLLDELVGVQELPAAIEQQLGLRDREGRDSPVNPLFLEEAVNVMMDIGVLDRGNGRLHINEALLSHMQVPDTIHGLLLARLDRLPPASRDLLQVASVIGRQFGVEPLHMMVPTLPLHTISDLLSSLSAEEMTRLVTADPEWIYLFQHAMTHEVAYESLPYVRRQDLHAGLARWLEQAYADNLKPIHAVLAYHYSRANNHEKALHFALAGADDARNVFANGDAVELYTLAEKHLLALGLEERWETAVTLYLGRSEALRFLGEFAEAVMYAEKALKFANKHIQNTLIVESYNLLAELKYRQANYREAKEATEAAIERWKDNISLDELARSHHWAGMSATTLLNYDEALSHLQRAEQICIETNNKKRLGQVLEGLAYIYYAQRDLEKAQKAMQESVALSRNYSFPANVVSALNNLALVQYMLGMVQEALQTYNEAIELLQDSSRNFLAHVLVNRATILAYLGQFSAALVDFETALAHFEGVKDEYGLVEAHLLWGYEYHCVRGEWVEAREHFDKAAQIIHHKPDGYQEEQLRLWLGYAHLALESNALTESLAFLKKAELLVTQSSFVWWEPAIAYLKGRALIATGNKADGVQLLLQVNELVTAGGCPEYWPLALLTLAQSETHTRKKATYFQSCVKAANKRARHLDKMKCLQMSDDFFKQLEAHLDSTQQE